MASKRSCAISASQPPRRKWDLVWSGSQTPRTPEFTSIIEMLGRVEEDPQSRPLAFFRVLTRTPSVGECTRFMHTQTWEFSTVVVRRRYRSLLCRCLHRRFGSDVRTLLESVEGHKSIQVIFNLHRETLNRVKLSTNSSCTYMLQFLRRDGSPVFPSRAKTPVPEHERHEDREQTMKGCSQARLLRSRSRERWASPQTCGQASVHKLAVRTVRRQLWNRDDVMRQDDAMIRARPLRQEMVTEDSAT